MSLKLKFTLSQVESLLRQQKQHTIERLLSTTYLYNTNSKVGCQFSIDNIDKEKFKEEGMKATFPEDFKILQKYLSEE